ncbi:hypothetical protein [Granulicella mallensis]|uniref:Uncharacterized protein n=1 Tax=Granulicella mallensis TaxID=940614 RepID=A0A7W7ZLN6_9BACT|nr:hypothetical protein [Granulicella mallensis]MBB5062214.1 hypothetical protein [Granulicella mallensis]
MKVRVRTICVVLLFIAALSLYPPQPISAQPSSPRAPQVRMKLHDFMQGPDGVRARSS